MRTSKKIVSLVLAVLMVASMMVVGAVSASAMTASDLNTALAAGGTVTLDSDVDLGAGSATVPAGVTVTLDLNGYTLSSTKFTIQNNGTLTIKDSVGTGEVIGQYAVRPHANSTTTIQSGSFIAQECAVSTAKGDHDAKITISGGTFTTVDNSVLSGNGSANSGNNKWTISGGTFNANITSAGYVAAGIYAPNNDTWTISGGTFNVDNGVGIAQRAGTVKVTGGTFNVEGDGREGKVGDSRVVLPAGTAIVYDSKANYPAQDENAKTTVTAGTFNTDQTPVVQVKDDSEAIRVTVSGGTFDNEVNATYIDPIYEYDADSDKIVAKTGLTDTWAWVDSTSASYRYQAQLTLKDGDTVVYTKNYDPTVTVVDDDFNYTCAAKKVAGISYGPIEDKLVEANGEIMTSWELYQATKAGGSWKLGKDLNCTYYTVADGFKLDGQNHKLTTTTINAGNAMFQVKDKNSKFELSNITLDGANKRYYAVSTYDSKSGGNNPNAEVTLTNVTIQNFSSGNYTGAVYAFGSSTVNLNGCTIVGNKVKATTADEKANTGAAVWAGAKATVNINGGEYDEVLLHGGTANVTVDGDAEVDTIRFGYTKATEDSTKAKAVINNGTVGEVVSYTEFVAENVDMDPDNATVGAPAGYKWVDSAVESGMKTLVLDTDDSFLLFGYQNKDVKTTQSKDAEGNDINTKGVRILTKVNDDTDVTEYGYVVAKVTGKDQENANFTKLTKDGGNGQKVIDCTGTYNNGILGVDNTYVTLAVNGMEAGDQVAVRFYYVKDGNTYYANYINTVVYDGIVATMA